MAAATGTHAHQEKEKTAVPLMATVTAFESFCRQLEANTSPTVKQEIIAGYIKRYQAECPAGSGPYAADLELIYRLLLPKQSGRLYRLQDKQLIKLLSLILKVPQDKVKNHLNTTGCIAKTAQHFFSPSIVSQFVGGGQTKQKMSLQALDQHLQKLSEVTTEDKQLDLVGKFFRVATKEEVYIYLRVIKQDLRLGAAVRTFLYALHPNAYAIYQQCANIAEVVRRVLAGDTDAAEVDDVSVGGDSPGGRSLSPPVTPRKGAVASITLNMPVAPMLAAPSKDVDQVLLKCPNGAFSEVKYDGERIQIHKEGTKFNYFARSLKPMKDDKYEGLQVHLEKALAGVHSCILDGEILLVDRKTSQPLPFGTLGKHKKAAFTDANTALFIFDIMYLEGKSLLNEPLDKRRQTLSETLVIQPLRVLLSEKRNVTGTGEQRKTLLNAHFQHAIKEGLEGLVVKDTKSIYEPNARRWVKMKKDYQTGLADSADLVVLGGYYGSGNKGGQLSVFLMGCLDKSVPANAPKRWKTVCKCGNGHDDATIAALNKKYKETMVPCERKFPPHWLDIKTAHVPDVVVKEPMNSDVWEIIGAEFSQTKNHTAGGISFRFPRILNIRDDKTVNEATSLAELQKLYEVSKEKLTRTHDLPGMDPDAVSNAASEEAVSAAVTPAGDGGAKPFQSPFAAAVAAAEEKHEEHITRLSSASGIRVQEEPASAPPARTATLAPSVPTATIQQQPSTGTAGGEASGGKIPMVTRDAVQAAKEATDAVMTKTGGHQLMIHLVATGGRWSQRGVMGSITHHLGDRTAKDYNVQSRDLKLGNVLVSEAYKSPKGKILFVGSLLVQSFPTKGAPPAIDLSSLAVAISKAAAFAMRQGAAMTHFAKPYPDDPAVPWCTIENLLAKHFVRVGLAITVYGREASVVAPGAAAVAVPRHTPAEATRTVAGEGNVPTSAARQTLKNLTASILAGDEDEDDVATPRPVAKAEGGGTGVAFKSMLVAIDPAAFSLRDLDVVTQKVEWLGGKTIDFSTVTQHHQKAEHLHIVSSPSAVLSAASAATVKFATAHRVPIVTRTFVDDCFAKQQRLSLAPGSPYVIGGLSTHAPSHSTATAGAPLMEKQHSGSGVFNALSSCRIVLQGFVDPALSELSSKIKMMGGEVQDKWRASGLHPSTHMVCGFWCPAAMRAQDLGGAVVSRRWIDECLDKGTRQPMEGYLMDEKEHSATIEEEEPPMAQHKARTPSRLSAGVPLSPPPPRDEAKAEVPVRILSELDAEAEAHRCEHDEVFSLKVIDSSHVSGKASTVLQGLKFYIEGYSPAIVAALQSRLRALGGTVLHTASTADYVICDLMTTTTDAMHGAPARNKILTWRWVEQCFKEKRKVEVGHFTYDNVRIPRQQEPSVGARRQRVPVPVESDTETDADAPPPRRPFKPTGSKGSHTEPVMTGTDDDSAPPPGRKRGREQAVVISDSEATVTEASDEDAPPPPRRSALQRLSSKYIDEEVHASLPTPFLEGCHFVLMIGDEHSKRDVQRSILAYGGKLKRALSREGTKLSARRSSSSAGGHTFVVVGTSGTDKERAQSAVHHLPKDAEDRQASVVRVDWVKVCVAQKKRLPAGPYLVC